MSDMPLSMTGYAVVRGEGFELTLKSVNHRFLDLHLRLPSLLDDLTAPIRQMLKERLRRGHVEVIVHLTALPAETGKAGGVPAIPQLNHAAITSYITQFRDIARQHHLGSDPDVAGLLRLPGVILTDSAARTNDQADLAWVQAIREEVLAQMPAAIELLQQARATEGAELAATLRASMGRVAELTEEAKRLRENVRLAIYERMRLRIAELIGGESSTEGRVLQEAALLADRSDVEEEIVRLETHVRQFHTLLGETAEVGKRLDFLLQELNREANTLLSKTGGSLGPEGLRLTEIGLAMKIEFERAKEQVQNME